MKDPKNALIAVLCVSAAMLGCILVLTNASTPVARADSGVAGGEYIIVAGQISDARGMLYVIDIAQQKLNAYEFNSQTRAIDLRDQVNLTLAFRDQLPPPAPR